MSNDSFNFGSFIKESIDALIKPKEYFPTLKVDGSLGGPVIKALIYGAISGVFAFLWSVLNLSAAVGGWGSAIGIMALIWAIIGALIGLFIGAVITLIISAICGGSTDYIANAHVTAALMVLMPISSFLGVISGLSLTLGVILKLAVNLYGIYMLYFALVGPLKAKEGSAKVLSWILVAIIALFMVIGIFTKRAANKFMDDFGITDELMEDYSKDVKKGLKDLSKDLEEAMEDKAEEIDKEEGE